MEPPPTTALPLAIEALEVAYGERTVLSEVDLETHPGNLLAVVGPNGAGKSTLLKAIVGLVRPTRGRISIFGRPITEARERIAYVPQRSSVDWEFPATAIEVVAMGFYRRIGWMRPVRRRHHDAAREQLARVGLGDLADRQIGQFSGGQQQRIFLARALAQDADLYLMDEPLAGVDAATETVILDVMAELKRAGRTLLCVHHDLDTVARAFDQVLLLAGRQIAVGPVATTFTPENLQRTYGARLLFATAPSPDRA